MMKKLLVFLVMMSLLSVVGVFAATGDQNVTVTIGESIVVVITPNPLTFGSVVAGSTNNAATNGPISIDPNGSNVDVNVTVTSVTGEPFASGLKFDGSFATGQNYNILCSGNPCAYTPASIVPTLDVITGFPAGLQSGVITYTITGPTP